MADNDQIEQGRMYIFYQNIGVSFGGLGKNHKLDGRVAVVNRVNYPSEGRHRVRFDDGVEIIALDRELHTD